MGWSSLLEYSTWTGWLESIFSSPANVIALAAVFIAFMNTWSQKRHGMLSVQPAFATWAEYPSEERPICEIKLSNKGFGPATITSVEVWNGHYEIPGRFHLKMRNLIESAFKGYSFNIIWVGSVDIGHAFGAGDSVIMGRFEVEKALAMCDDDYFMDILEPVALVVRYKDIYRRRWIYAVNQFEGDVYRNTWWNLRLQWARWISGKHV